MSELPSNVEPVDHDDRRAYVRYRRRLDVVWQILGLSARDTIPGRIIDVSQTGVGLTVDQPFAEEAVLMVRLPSKTRGWSSHLVRVRHCRPLAPGHFKLGCVFLKPLSDDELQLHLA